MQDPVKMPDIPVFRDFLFSKGYLVNTSGDDREGCVRTLYALANVFGIRIVKNPQAVTWDMVEAASRLIGRKVPEPFYRGFPQSVLKLTDEQRIIDQLIHYAITYGLNDFSQPGHSILEEEFERIAFREKTEQKEYAVVYAEEAYSLLRTYLDGMLSSSRPLNQAQEELVAAFAERFPEDITVCRSKDTAIGLICATRNVSFARFLQLPDVIKLADEVNERFGLPPVPPNDEARRYEEKMRLYQETLERNRQRREQYHQQYRDEIRRHDEQQSAYNAAYSRYNKDMQTYRLVLRAYDGQWTRYSGLKQQYEKDLAEYQRLLAEYLRRYPETGLDGLISRIRRRFTPAPPRPKPPVCPQPPSADRPREPVRPNPPPPLPTLDLEQAYPPVPPRVPKKSLRCLNLKNRDRKLIAAVIDTFFEQEHSNIRDCYEKRRDWAGLLHHIHYVPKNERAAAFAASMRGKGENLSVAAELEKAMEQGSIVEAAQFLAREKGGSAVARNLNYLLSRCDTEEEIEAVLAQLGGMSLIVQLQLQQMYARAQHGPRTFRFIRHQRLAVHKETDDEAANRQSVLYDDTLETVRRCLRGLMEQTLRKKQIGRVYVEPGMERIALPLQEASGASGPGTLPKGSCVPIPEGKKIRCFTYWEKVNDIDLACFGLDGESSCTQEFSWRTMANRQSEALVYSGDETSGYNGGSEFFDVDIPAFRAAYPSMRYIVFTDNVFSSDTFDRVYCKAGFMLRDEEDSGQIFEPKTVQTSFTVNAKSTFACLFAVDLDKREMVWLNLGLQSEEHVAGSTDINVIRDYLNTADVMNLAAFFKGMATALADSPEDADVIVADHFTGPLRDGQTLIRSCDFEKVLPFMQGK